MENTNHKRHREHDDADINDEPEAKRHKTSSNATPTKITDLPENCLMNIFSHLDLSCLLNVAMANKKLQLAAATTFGSEFGIKTICLENVMNSSPPRIYTLDDEIYVRGLKLCLPFLRCFGGQITKLFALDGSYPHVLISNGYKSQFSHHVDRYLNQYCTDSVSHLLFYGRPAFSMENFRKSFCMVKQLRLIDTALDDGLPNFGKWFPNVNHLEMNTVYIDGPLNAPVPLPLLQHLILKINNNTSSTHDDDGQNNCEWNFSVRNAIEFLSQNQHLRSIEIDMADHQKIKIDKLLDIIKRNLSISKLTMTDGSLYEDVSMDELQRLASERPLINEIDLPRHRFTVEQVEICIHHLKELKKFRFQMIDWSDYDQLVQRFGSDWQFKQFHQTVQLILKTH